MNDAQAALIAMASEEAYLPGQLESKLLPAALARNWVVIGYLTGQDSLLRGGPIQLLDQRVFYGWLLRSSAAPTEYLCVVRGTDGLVEWLEDAEFGQRVHPRGGMVEAGFYGVYQSIHYAPTPADERPLIASLNLICGASPVTVIGHSLGAALATYLTLDLAAAGCNVRGRFFAPPRPGNAEFADIFQKLVKDYAAYAYELDLVPRVPFGMGYAPLHNTRTLLPIPLKRIRCNVGCNHHALCYAMLIDPTSIEGIASPYLDCISASPAVA